jgi:hypothetical protein
VDERGGGAIFRTGQLPGLSCPVCSDGIHSCELGIVSADILCVLNYPSED